MSQPPLLSPGVSTILFDHDGTLIDSEQIHFEIWAGIIAQFGHTLTFDAYCDNLAGIPVKQNAVDLQHMFILDITPAELAEQKHSRLREYLNQRAFPLISDALSTLQACYNAGYTLGIVTGGARQSVERTINDYGLTDMISAVVAVEDVETSKPAPDCYLKAMRLLDVDAPQCVAVEDTQHGMRAALGAAIPCIVVPTALSAQHDFSAANASYPSLSAWIENEKLSNFGVKNR